jgi:hypothetical protein
MRGVGFGRSFIHLGWQVTGKCGKCGRIIPAVFTTESSPVKEERYDSAPA